MLLAADFESLFRKGIAEMRMLIHKDARRY
jgi:hypothetical protein